MLDVNRKVPRFCFDFEISSNNIRGVGVNISLKGIGFITKEEIVSAYEIPFIITIKLNDKNEYILEGLGNILFSEKNKRGDGFYAGFEFINLTEKSKDNLLTILSNTIDNQRQADFTVRDRRFNYFYIFPFDDVLNKADLFYHVKEDFINNKYGVFTYSKDGNKSTFSRYPDYKESDMINFGCDDFLGLSINQDVIKAGRIASEKYGNINRSYLLNGSILSIIKEAEESLADYLNMESAILTSSGYLSALGTISGIARPGDVVILNQSVSCGLKEGTVLSQARNLFFANYNSSSLKRILKRADEKYNGKVVVFNKMDSITGIIDVLDELLKLTEDINYTRVIDESNIIGLNNPIKLNGKADILIGSLNESLGINGGFTASRKEVIEYLKYFSKTFISNNGISPYDAGALLKSLDILRNDTEIKDRLFKNIELFIVGLKRIGISPMCDFSPVVSITIKDEILIKKISQNLFSDGIYHTFLNYPYVPMGGALLRFSINVNHSESDISKCLEVIENAFNE